jgi:hypothetical protein
MKPLLKHLLMNMSRMEGEKSFLSGNWRRIKSSGELKHFNCKRRRSPNKE